MSSDPRSSEAADATADVAADDSAGAAGPPSLDLTVVLARLEVPDAEEALQLLAERLRDAGTVTASFPEALRRREERYPTGLPTPIPTAIPHADPEHVRVPGLAVATLAAPVPFGEMGGTGGTVDVQLIVMPLLTDARAHLAALQRVMGLLRDETAVAELLTAADDDSLRALAARHLGAGGGTA